VDELWPFSLKKLLKDELWTDKPWTALLLWTAFPRLVHNCEWVHSLSVHRPRWFNFLLWVISSMSPDFLPYWLPPHFYQITVGCIIGCTIGCTEHNWLQNLKPRYVIIAMLSLILVRKIFSQKCMCHSFCWRRRKKSSGCAAQTRMNYFTAIQCGEVRDYWITNASLLPSRRLCIASWICNIIACFKTVSERTVLLRKTFASEGLTPPTLTRRRYTLLPRVLANLTKTCSAWTVFWLYLLVTSREPPLVNEMFPNVFKTRPWNCA